MTTFRSLVNHCAVLYSVNEIKYQWHQIPGAIIYLERFFLFLFANMLTMDCLFLSTGITDNDGVEVLLIGFFVYFVMGTFIAVYMFII